jgi:hypothetical protein
VGPSGNRQEFRLHVKGLAIAWSVVALFKEIQELGVQTEVCTRKKKTKRNLQIPVTKGHR